MPSAPKALPTLRLRAEQPLPSTLHLCAWEGQVETGSLRGMGHALDVGPRGLAAPIRASFSVRGPVMWPLRLWPFSEVANAAAPTDSPATWGRGGSLGATRRRAEGPRRVKKKRLCFTPSCTPDNGHHVVWPHLPANPAPLAPCSACSSSGQAASVPEKGWPGERALGEAAQGPSSVTSPAAQVWLLQATCQLYKQLNQRHGPTAHRGTK